MLLMSGWDFLVAHPTNVGALPDVHTLALELWNDLKKTCQFNEIHLDVAYDEGTIGDRHILAYAARTLFLEDDHFVSGALSKRGYLGNVRIRVNPNPPNGWYVDDGTCNSGYRYDMKTVLRHELLHGIGISSSIRTSGAGYFLGAQCYPTIFDTLVEDQQHHKVVDGCLHTHTPGEDYFVDGVRLYNPPTFNEGSSMSHSNTPGLMWYAVPPMQCIDYDEDTWRFLHALNASCEIDTPDTAKPAYKPHEPRKTEQAQVDNPIKTALNSFGSMTKPSVYICIALLIKWSWALF